MSEHSEHCPFDELDTDGCSIGCILVDNGLMEAPHDGCEDCGAWDFIRAVLRLDNASDATLRAVVEDKDKWLIAVKKRCGNCEYYIAGNLECEYATEKEGISTRFRSNHPPCNKWRLDYDLEVGDSDGC